MSYVYIVQRATALYSDYDDRLTQIINIFDNIEAANEAVRACKKEFVVEFGIQQAEVEADESNWFLWEDRGNGSEVVGQGRERMEGGQKGRKGTAVGLYWEFDDGSCWYSCGVERWEVQGTGKGA